MLDHFAAVSVLHFDAEVVCPDVVIGEFPDMTPVVVLKVNQLGAVLYSFVSTGSGSEFSHGSKV